MVWQILRITNSKHEANINYLNDDLRLKDAKDVTFVCVSQLHGIDLLGDQSCY